MKSLLVTALAAVSFNASAFAYTPKDPIVPAIAAMPRVISGSVVKPSNLPLDFNRALIDIEFSLDASGRPQDIKVRSVKDPALRRRLVDAFRQWRFERAAGEAVDSTKRYILPLDVRAES
jgi:hypothetical protein